MTREDLEAEINTLRADILRTTDEIRALKARVGAVLDRVRG